MQKLTYGIASFAFVLLLASRPVSAQTFNLMPRRTAQRGDEPHGCGARPQAGGDVGENSAWYRFSLAQYSEPGREAPASRRLAALQRVAHGRTAICAPKREPGKRSGSLALRSITSLFAATLLADGAGGTLA
ncbi:exported hypothetical protein [Acidobacteriia bacterium SbA2]|nr:exported hypothetical protein [Acidobacteriia bacterium SbA2]